MSKPGYPMWWDTKLTIYNKFEDPQTHVVMWFRTVVSDCFWKYAGSRVSVGDVVLDSKSVLCRIPKDDKYLDKYAWIVLPNDEMGEYFTLGQGDIIVRGEVSDVIDEYTAGKRSSDLLAKYGALQECMKIEEFSNNTGIGRNNEHYFARGK